MSLPRLLIIDDDAISRETLSAILAGSGYSIQCAASGAEGLKNAPRFNPDVILLDVMMPGMNGFEVCRSMRKDPSLAEVPIIMVTALDDRDSRLAGLEAGADDFLSKPYDSMELEIRLRSLKRVARYRHLVEERTKLDEVNQLLQQRNEELKLLSGKVIEIQETERRRLAMELHDEIGQQLTGLNIILKDTASDHEEGLRAKCQLALAVANQLLSQVRELSLDLRPAMLDDLGLVAALDWLFKRFTRQTKITVLHNLNPVDERRFPHLIETAAFRLVQEALTNVARHAEVNEVTVTLDFEPDLVKVTVLDSGKGFDMASLSPGTSTGISAMGERVSWAKGKFQISTSPNEGTLVEAVFPLLEKE
jgi:signal transduction histidine kinase